MGNRLFAISHRAVYDLFKAWGWEDGPVKPDGHHRMVWPATGQVVQIMPPHRPGTGEKGNAIAMKQARKIMELDSVQRFLDGPVKEKATKEKYMRTTENTVVVTGTRELLGKILQENEGRPLSIEWIQNEAIKTNEAYKGEYGYTKISSNLSQMGGTAKWPQVTRIKRGVYMWKEPVVVNEPEPAPPVETYVEPEPEVSSFAPVVADARSLIPKRPVFDPVPAPKAAAPVSLNGSTPDLLSKVHVLDGGRYLFQGDDGALYVISSITRLEV